MHFCGRCWCHSRTRNRKCFTHFVGFSISWVMRKTAKSKKSKMKFQFESFEYSIRIQSLLQPVGYQSFKDILQEQPKKKHVNLITGIIIYIRLLNRLARFFLSWLDPMDTFDWLRLIFLFFLLLLLLYSFLFSLTAPYLPICKSDCMLVSCCLPKALATKPRNKKVLRKPTEETKIKEELII